jgi:hypothetical protein
MKQLALLFFCIIVQLSCKITKRNSSTESVTNNTKTVTSNDLIKDCPEELIMNVMPSIGKPNSNKKNQYYVYKGLRKEIIEFDSVWISKNCKVKTTVVQ